MGAVKVMIKCGLRGSAEIRFQKKPKQQQIREQILGEIFPLRSYPRCNYKFLDESKNHIS